MGAVQALDVGTRVTTPPPPRLADLRAGATLRAGLGVATVLPDIDFETYSEAGYVWDAATQRWVCLPRASQGKKGLSVVGSARYAEHPSTKVLCVAYDLKDGRGKRLWRPGDPPPVDLWLHVLSGGLLEAWNVGFERQIWEHVCTARMGWPPVLRHQWRCAMAKARAHALPGALAEAGDVLATDVRKDKRGKQLLDRYSVPRQPTKANAALRNLPVDPTLYDYCLGDIATEAEISSRTPDLPPGELDYWQVDQEINARGVATDMVAVRECIAVVERVLADAERELVQITDGAVPAVSMIARMQAWLHTRGVHLDSLDEEGVTAALAGDLPPFARRVLEIRAAAGSSSVKKLFAMANQVCADGRLRGLFSYHAARTGRSTGNGPQPTNLPNHGPSVARCAGCGRHSGLSCDRCPWCGHNGRETVEWSPGAVADALAVMPAVEHFFGSPLPVVSGCLRGLFVAAPGHDLICSDYSAIEAVVLAELAGEGWRQEVFRTHGKIYEASASKITGIPLEEILDYRKRTGSHHPIRKLGKVAELASGYRGWIGSWVAFGAEEFLTAQQIEDGVRGWRQASPMICNMWYGVEDAAIGAVMSPGVWMSCRAVSFIMHGDALYCRLPSGRLLTYHRPRLEPSTRRAGQWQMSYEGWNSNPKNGPMGWIRMQTHGGKLVENLVQAVARDIQRDALVRQERAGYRIVLHVYDENVAEVPEGWGSVEEFEALMNEMPTWAAGWPIRARGGWRGKRYRKD